MEMGYANWEREYWKRINEFGPSTVGWSFARKRYCSAADRLNRKGVIRLSSYLCEICEM
jgi:hypothetical protein